MKLVQQTQGIKEPYHIVATDDHSVLLAITKVLMADKASFCYVNRLPQLLILLEEILQQIIIIDMAPWGTHLAMVMAEHVGSHTDCSCICIVTESQAQEIRAQSWNGHLYLIAKERLTEELPVALRESSKAQRLRNQAENVLLLQKESLYNTLSKEADQMKPEDQSIFKQKFTRRSFLKGAAATAAAAGVVVSGGGNLLSPLAEAAGEAESVEQVFRGACRGNCGTNCALNVHVRNGKVVKTSKLDLPLPEFERICQRGLTHAQRIYDSNRLTHPLRRVGERGAGEWEQITWEEAINEICTKWKHYQKEYGKESIAYCDGYGALSSDINHYMRLFNLMGTTHIQNAIDRAVIDTFPASTGAGTWLSGDDPRNMVKSKYIFAWGCNITEAGHVAYAYLQAALDAGAKLIAINPHFDTGASKADMFVPIRPGTDAVLAMAMINIAVAEGKIDENTLMYGTVAPFLVKESTGKFLRLSDLGQAEAGSAEDEIVVRAEDGTIGLPADITKPVIHGNFKVQGYDVTTAYDLLLERVAEWTPERASEICDIPLETIRELAEMYMEGPSTLYLSLGQDHWGNGHTFYYAVTALAVVTGQIGKEGAGINGHSISIYVADVSNNSHILNPPEASPGPEMFAPLVPDAVNSGKYGDLDVNIKSLFIYKHNLVGNQSDRQAWLRTFDQIEFVVVPDVIMSETTKYADIVLPVPHFFEVETYFMTYGGVAVYNEKAIEPLEEAMGDFEIATLLGRGMGYGDLFTMTREEYLTEIFNNDNAKAAGIDWKTLKEKGYIPMTTADTPVYILGKDYIYPTTTGRAQFYREDVAPTSNYGQKFDLKHEALPYWEPPIEGWPETVDGFERNPSAEKYPLLFMSERPKFKSHTSYSHNPWLLELLPEPTVTLHPLDAETRGIKTGDTIKVYNDRGYVVIKAAVNSGNRPGIVNIDHGWVEDEFIEGHYQDLSSCRSSDVVINNAYFDCLVEAVKV